MYLQYAPYSLSTDQRARAAGPTTNLSLEHIPDSRLIVLFVIEPIPNDSELEEQHEGFFEKAYEKAQNTLSKAHTRASEHSGTFESTCIYGHPINAILHSIDTYFADQVVIGQFKEQNTQRSLGTATETIVRRSPVPITVLQSPHDGRSAAGPESVLVPFDGSVQSRNALTYAISNFPSATITALYADYPVVDHLGQPGIESDPSISFQEWYERAREWQEDASRDPRNILQIAKSVADRHDVEIHTADEPGNPSDRIVGYTTRNGTDTS